MRRVTLILLSDFLHRVPRLIVKMRVVHLLLLALSFVGTSYASKILAIVPTPTKSHHYLIEKLAVNLANRGHQVTFITPFPQEKPLQNLEEIIVPNYYDSLMASFMGKNGEKTVDVSDMQKSIFSSMFALHSMGLHMSETLLSTPVVKKFLQSNRKYDVIISEAFFVEGILGGVVKKFDAPLIAVSPGPATFYTNYLVGNPSPSAYVPSVLLGITDQMTFNERLLNFVFETMSSVYFNNFYLPMQDKIMRKHFGNDLPDIRTIMTNTSLVLVNHHHSLAFPRPYLPNVIEIGGYHVNPPQPLPEDLQQYLDSSKNGVILLSMGSHMKSSLLPKDTVQAILKAFSRLKEDVIWKLDKSDMPGLPKNVRIMKWLPQSDILAHPNLKLLITHGGLLSTTEAVIRGVPFIGLPAFGDQPANMKFFEKAGYAKTLSIVGLTENALYDTIQEMLQNPKYVCFVENVAVCHASENINPKSATICGGVTTISSTTSTASKVRLLFARAVTEPVKLVLISVTDRYKENMKKASVLLQDTPRPAVETAMYWIEYIIRHKGAPHLRSGALDLEWYQLYLLDVFAVFLAVAGIFAWISYKIASAIWRRLCGRKAAKASKTKKTN